MAEAQHFTVDVKGGKGEIEFGALTGFDEISRPFRYEVSFTSDAPDIKATDVLGKAVCVTVPGEKPRHFHGFISEFSVVSVREDVTDYRVVARPWLWFLSLRKDNRIFQNKSVIEIIEEVYKDQSQGRFDHGRLKKKYPPREYCVQYGESDLDFVQRLLEHEGIGYFFEHAEDRHTLVLFDVSSDLKPPEGLTTLELQTDRGPSGGDADFISAWTPGAAVMSGKFSHTDYHFKKPSTDLMAMAENPIGHDSDGLEVYHYPGAYIEHDRGDALAAVRLEELQHPFTRVHAEGRTRPVWSGHTFRFEGHPREAENGEYLVLRADYRLARHLEQRTEAEGAGGFRAELLLAPKAVPFRPERRTPKPVMRGPQTAKVVGPAGAEIYTDKHARVKVQFHWDRKGKKDENTTCFIRVSQTWAGASWGFIQIPRIGHEVIVDFLEGDPDMPIITGRVYNAENMPPYALPGNATQSGWKSNSSPGGGGFNELRFEDKKGSEEVYFQAEKDHNELIKNNESRRIGNDFAEDVGHDAKQDIGHDRTETVGNDKSVTVGNNRTVKIGVNDDETVGSNRSLTVGSNETISIGSNSTETIGLNHAQTVGVAQEITVGAARAVTVGASETKTVGASQSGTIGADRSMTVGSNQTHSVGSDDGWTVGGSQTIEIGKDQALTIAGAQTISVGKDQSSTVGGARAAAVAKDDGLKVDGKMGIKVGKSFLLDVADEIAIKCGSAAITLKKDGTINIEGKDITVKGSGKINFKASGEITAKGSKINLN